MNAELRTKKRRILQTLWNKLDAHLLPFAKDGVVLAVSGGPDSRTLLEAIAFWPKRLAGRFIVASIDHGVRFEAKKEANFIALRAQRLGFDTVIENIFSSSNASEHDLRTERYRLLKKIAHTHSCQTICLAHHGDDNAEGYFMALMGVGGGELGAAMREVETLNDIVLIRPFLSLAKADLLNALTVAGYTDVVTDRLDEAGKNQRALVRNFIFPRLARLAPALKNRLKTFGVRQALQARTVEKLADSLIVWEKDRAFLPLPSFFDQAVMTSALWQILKKLSNQEDLRSSQSKIDAIVGLFMDKTPRLRSKNSPGLDPTPNEFNLKHLSVKRYQFPGVLVLVDKKGIVAERI